MSFFEQPTRQKQALPGGWAIAVLFCIVGACVLLTLILLVVAWIGGGLR